MKHLVYAFSLLFLFACNQQNHFIKDGRYRKEVKQKFEQRKQLAKNREHQLFAIFQQDLPQEQKEALQFLYAYMPLSDLMDYDSDFHYKQVKYAFQARETFPWGKEISDADFRHFVLPYRVNNENPDTARMVFFRELKERVKGMSMKEAALEINHWCHEKVTYIGSDIRTSAPLATVKNAKGRCGEESTFAVAAYRAACIPARQCYTPRWVHCDDNHAWVEIFVDGKWQYTGACEPEAELNQGWFTQPAQKAMLVHTKVFGKYNGYEKATYHADNFSELNLLEKYTKTDQIQILVKDEKGNPVENADVQYAVLNYGEFYPLVTKKTNEKGESQFTSGLGSLLIWVNKEDQFAFEKIDVSQQKNMEIILKNSSDFIGNNFFFELNPSEYEDSTKFAKPNEANNQRLKEEDAIRHAYENTFIDSAAIVQFANKHNLDAEKAVKYIRNSRGNHAEIMQFISSVSEEKKQLIFPLLRVISNKDLHDTKTSVLLDHINESVQTENEKEIFEEYVLNPRIKNEILSPYKAFIKDYFLNANLQRKAEEIQKWILKNIQISTTENYYRTPLTPIGVLNGKIADEKSRDLLFVAICRTFGIPARIEPASLQTQYYQDGKWNFIAFGKTKTSAPEFGTIQLKNISKQFKADPEYYKNFTIAKLEKGKLKTLEFDFMKKLSKFQSNIPLQTGTYALTTASRKQNGGVLTKLSFFTIGAKEKKKLNVEVLKAIYREKVHANFNLNCAMSLLNDKRAVIPASLTHEKPIVIAWLAPDKEPTKHALVEIEQLKKEYEKLGNTLVFSIPKKKQTAAFKTSNYQFPNQSVFVEDEKMLKQLEEKSGIKLKEDFPVFTIIKPNGEVVYLNKGYKIDLGKEIQHLLQDLNQSENSCRFTE